MMLESAKRFCGDIVLQPLGIDHFSEFGSIRSSAIVI